MGCPFPSLWVKGNAGISFTGNAVLGKYTHTLMQKLNSLHGDVSLSLHLPYNNPTMVLAVTWTTVLTDSPPQWIHANRYKTDGKWSALI